MAVLTSIVFGVTVTHDVVSSTVGLVFALVILLASICGIAFCNEIGSLFATMKKKKNPQGRSVGRSVGRSSCRSVCWCAGRRVWLV